MKSTKKNHLDIQYVDEAAYAPTTEKLQCWVDAALEKNDKPVELLIRIVSEAESAQLNKRFRNKTGATNILSFPAELPEFLASDYLGDLVVCAPLLAKEAKQQNKRLHEHWAHIVVHGVLHLMGYDHIQENAATEMESLEIFILKKLHINNPYQEVIYQ